MISGLGLSINMICLKTDKMTVGTICTRALNCKIESNHSIDNKYLLLWGSCFANSTYILVTLLTLQ